MAKLESLYYAVALSPLLFGIPAGAAALPSCTSFWRTGRVQKLCTDGHAASDAQCTETCCAGGGQGGDVCNTCCDTLFTNKPKPLCTGTVYTDGRDMSVCQATDSCKGVNPLLPCNGTGRKELLTDEQCQAACCVTTDDRDDPIPPEDQVLGIEQCSHCCKLVTEPSPATNLCGKGCLYKDGVPTCAGTTDECTQATNWDHGGMWPVGYCTCCKSGTPDNQHRQDPPCSYPPTPPPTSQVCTPPNCNVCAECCKDYLKNQTDCQQCVSQECTWTMV